MKIPQTFWTLSAQVSGRVSGVGVNTGKKTFKNFQIFKDFPTLSAQVSGRVSGVGVSPPRRATKLSPLPEGAANLLPWDDCDDAFVLLL